MKITDLTQVLTTRTTTLNDIPVGQVFRGTIERGDSHYESGVFFKALGSWNAPLKSGPHPDRTHRDVVVVRLDSTSSVRANVWTWCRKVTDYEPLTVELVIHGVQR